MIFTLPVKSRTDSDTSGQVLANSGSEPRQLVPENQQVPLSPLDSPEPSYIPIGFPTLQLFP